MRAFTSSKREGVLVALPVRLSDSDDDVAFHLKRFHEQSAVAIVPGLIAPNHQRGGFVQRVRVDLEPSR